MLEDTRSPRSQIGLATSPRMYSHPKQEGIDKNQLQRLLDVLEKLEVKNNEHGIPKYSLEWVLRELNGPALAKMQTRLSELEGQRADLVDFVKVLADVVMIDPQEGLFFVTCATDLFRRISETQDVQQFVDFKHITDFLIQELGMKMGEDFSIRTRATGVKAVFSEGLPPEVDPAEIVGGNPGAIRRFLKQNKFIDRNLHHEGAIKRPFFCSELNLFGGLGSKSGTVTLFDPGLIKTRELRPVETGSEPPTILDVSFSERHLRIGGCGADFSLYFWEASDGFHNSTKFSLVGLTELAPHRIWYLEILKDWVTSDSNLVINIWTLVGFKLVRSVSLTRPPMADTLMKNSVVEIQGLTHLNLILVGTLDGIISAHTTKEWSCVVTFSLGTGNLVSLEYSEEFRVFFAAGCENSVRVLSLTTKNHELAMVGKLTGHSHLVVAAKALEGTSLVVTCDEKGFIKLWDIRKLICVQTLRLPNATGISAIVTLDKNRVAFIGERFNIMEFEREEVAEGPANQPKGPLTVPIGAAACDSTQRFVVMTNTDLRSIDMKTGKVTHVYAKIIEPDDKVVSWVLDQRRNRFAIGTSNGRVSIRDLESTDLIRESLPHSGEVSGLLIDPKSQGVVSCGLDCQLNVFKDVAQEVERAKEVDLTTAPERTEEEEFFKQPMYFEGDGQAGFQKYKADIMKQANAKEVALQEEKRQSKLKVAPIKASEVVPTLDLLRQIKSCNEDSGILIMKVSLYHNLVALASNTNRVYLYNYEYGRPLSIINLPESSVEPTSIAFIDGFCKLLVAASPSRIYVFSLTYVSAFKVDVEYENCINLQQFCLRDMKQIDNPPRNLSVDVHWTQVNTNQLQVPRLALMHPINIKLGYADLFLSTTIENVDYVVRLDLTQLLLNEKAYDTAASHPHYNPSRRGFEDFNSSVLSLVQSATKVEDETPQKKRIDPVVKKAFRAARGPISSITVWHARETMLLVTAADRTFRIFTATGEMLCLLQLAYHLPTKWDLPLSALRNKRGELLLALQTVERLNQRHPDTVLRGSLSTRKILAELSKLLPNMTKKPSLENFRTFSLTGIEQEGQSRQQLQSLKSLQRTEEEIKPAAVVQLASSEDKPSQDVILLKQVYSEKDLAYEQIKAESREQIAGPTLRQLEYIRRAKSKDPLAELGSRAERLKMVPAKKKHTSTNPMAAYFGKLEMENPLKELVRREQFLKSMAGKIDHGLSKIDEEIDKAREASNSKLLQREVSFTTENPDPKVLSKSKSRRVSFKSQGSLQVKRLRADQSNSKLGSQTTRHKAPLNLAEIPATPQTGRISMHPGQSEGSNPATGRNSVAAGLVSPLPPTQLPRLNFSSALLRLPSNVIVEETSNAINLSSAGDFSSAGSRILKPASKSKLKSSVILSHPKIDMFSYARERNLLTMSTEHSKFKGSVISSTQDQSAFEKKNYLNIMQGQEGSQASLLDRKNVVSSDALLTNRVLSTGEESAWNTSDAKLSKETSGRLMSPKNERREEQQRFHMILKSMNEKITRSKSKIPFAANSTTLLRTDPLETEGSQKPKSRRTQPVKAKNLLKQEGSQQETPSLLLEPIQTPVKRSEPMQLTTALALIDKELEEADNLELRFLSLKAQQRSKVSSPRKQVRLNSPGKRKGGETSPGLKRGGKSRSVSPENSVLPRLQKV